VTEFVIRLAKLALEAGLDGVVSSAKEISAIRKACGANFLIVTPGIRPAWSAADDQKRIVTPKQAVQDGVDYIVVGRPIIQSKDRRDAARRIVEEMES
jgi:orotidine-5'-phosphate decarboxylase